jgi:hypothetical protein
MSKIIQEGLNWIIITHITDLGFSEPLLADIDTSDFKMYTSAKGLNSKQYYLIPPKWLPNSTVKEPEIWPKLKDWSEKHVQKELVYHAKMPDNWKKIHAFSSWVVKGEEGSFHTLHDHGPNNISSVFYLEVPETNDSIQGQIYFILHSDPYSSLSVPRIRSLHFVPTKGSLIIFPSWIPHGVYPQGPGSRITLNIYFNGNTHFNFDDPTAGHMTYSGLSNFS